ncbi:MAG TPA: hypothetical protein VL051_12945 [Burkholderiaceae bacterium]|nr:hypothetical protein [Burkholderiaceae bacterium]
MNANKHTEEMIEDLVNVTCGEQASARERHVYREALRSLVRLAKAEQMFELKSDVQTLMNTSAEIILH